jgi:tripartite-type tricarboxylate transporter receptor subunit TctC
MTRSGATARFAAALCIAVLAASAADAQSRFPTRPIRIVSPFAAGSVSDVSLRLMADKLGTRINGQVIIDNQPRAGGIAAVTAVLSAPPDGYTIALLSSSTAISVSLFKHLPYDPLRDFAPVCGFTSSRISSPPAPPRATIPSAMSSPPPATGRAPSMSAPPRSDRRIT